jgi:hypothetical protein
MAKATGVFIGTKKGNETQALDGAWVYWNSDGTTTIMRACANGHLRQIQDGKKDSTLPRNYGKTFRADFDIDVKVYYSRGGRPIPAAVLDQHADVSSRARSGSYPRTCRFSRAVAWQRHSNRHMPATRSSSTSATVSSRRFQGTRS